MAIRWYVRTSIDVDVLYFDWIVLNAIGFHESNVMVIDGEREERSARN